MSFFYSTLLAKPAFSGCHNFIIVKTLPNITERDYVKETHPDELSHGKTKFQANHVDTRIIVVDATIRNVLESEFHNPIFHSAEF